MATLVHTNATPGGPVSPEEYAGEGVRFAAGASLIQNNTALANTSKMTISLWMKVHTPPVSSQFGPLFTITKPIGGGGFEEDYVLGVSSIRPGVNSSIDMETKSYSAGVQAAGDGATNFDEDPLVEDGEWHHVFQTVDTSGSHPAWLLYVDGEASTLTNTSDSGYPTAMTINGKNIGFPASSDVLADPLQFGTWSNGYPADVSDVQIWFGQAIDPVATQTLYSAKTNPQPSRTIRDMVNYMNSRGVSPVEALAVMNIESTYGALSRNYFQFLQPSAFNLILGYTGVATNNTDLNRALANAWLGFRPNGSVVGAPNNYPVLARQLSGDAPFAWQKYLIHNLGGSAPEPARTSINGYDLLVAWVEDIEDETMTLGEILNANGNPGGLGLMLAQSKIWGASGPIGTVNSSTTVHNAIEALKTVWNAAMTDALRFLDSSTKTNLSYFIDDDGFAVPPAAATDKFGLQTFLFTGSEEDFIFNQGNGGDVTLVGEIATVAGPND